MRGALTVCMSTVLVAKNLSWKVLSIKKLVGGGLPEKTAMEKKLRNRIYQKISRDCGSIHPSGLVIENFCILWRFLL